MKKILLVLALATITASAFAEPVADQTDTIKGILTAQVGQKVEIRLVSGEKLGGKVEKVGGETVRLSSVTGQEFFDAIVALDDVSAVLIRTKQ